jgi:hypothetical protein
MNPSLQVQVEALANEIQNATLPDKCKATAAWCLGQLPKLYQEFFQTSESRCCDQIAHLVSGMIKEFHTASSASADAKQLTASLPERFQALHEEFGLPHLTIKSPNPAPARTRSKAS